MNYTYSHGIPPTLNVYFNQTNPTRDIHNFWIFMRNKFLGRQTTQRWLNFILLQKKAISLQCVATSYLNRILVTIHKLLEEPGSRRTCAFLITKQKSPSYTNLSIACFNFIQVWVWLYSKTIQLIRSTNKISNMVSEVLNCNTWLENYLNQQLFLIIDKV